MKTLLLTERDVQRLLSTREAMEAVELAFAEKGLNRVQMPAKQFITFKNYNGDLRTMSSHLDALDISTVKVVTIYPENRAKHSFPATMATLIVIDPKNGAPIAIMGGTWITNIGAGVAGGIAAKYLARTNSKIVGLVGAGEQAKTQLMALCSLYGSLDEVRVWSRTKETRKAFVEEAGSKWKTVSRMIPVDEAENAVKGADIVVTTTPSASPVVFNDWISPGMHINCIGADAPGKQELDPAVLKQAKIVVDDWDQASHSGEINVPLKQGLIKPKDVWGEIGEIVAGTKKGRESDDEVTVFTSTGLAIQDAVTANVAYKKAMAQRMGQFIDIMG
jgi:alanine dehydrogenase